MAINKHGILGTPKGKIANLMCYRRNGKGIVQSVPTVVNKEKRRYNFNRNAIMDSLSSISNIFQFPFSAIWRSYLDVSSFNVDAYLNYQMPIADANYQKNLTGLWYLPPQAGVELGIFDDLSYSNGVVFIHTKLPIVDVSLPLTGNMRCFACDSSGTYLHELWTAYTSNNYYYSFDFGAFDLSNVSFFFVYVDPDGSLNNSERPMIDTLPFRT